MEPEANLSPLFQPRSIAVVGASPNPSKIGHQILRNIATGGYEGKIYPIHPTAESILNIKAYPSLTEVDDEIDLAVIAIPAEKVVGVVRECAAKGVKAVAVISSGFSEIGRVEEENELKRIAAESGMILLGPNIVGVVYVPSRLNATFGPPTIVEGRIAFISQSGALSIALMGWTAMEKIGLCSVVSVGNKAGLNEKDLIRYFQNDGHIDVILVYMEGLQNGRDLLDVTVDKPVIVLKVGRTQKGARAAASHTGSLAGSDRVFDGVFRQIGFLRASTFTEAFGWSRTLLLPTIDGEETIIITNGGGIGVRATDECEIHDIPLVEDTEWLERTFRDTMPSFGSTKNPIDLTGQASVTEYRAAVQRALMAERIKAVLVLYCETVITDPVQIAQAIKDEYNRRGRPKPLIVVMVGGERTRSAVHLLNDAAIPAFTAVNEAVSGLKALFEYKAIRLRPKPKLWSPAPPEEAERLIETVRQEGRSLLFEHEARRVLEACGIQTPPWGFAATLEEALAVAEGKYPLAMKIASLDIVHKTDVGGVVLNIRDAKELEYKFNQMMSHVKEIMPHARIAGVNLVRMTSGIECIVGLSHDPQFGPVVMFGLGGVFVEVMKDVVFRAVPFDDNEALRQIREVQGYRVLKGFRGHQANEQALARVLVQVQRIAGLVKEVDINPLMVRADGCFAVDARMVI